MEKLKTGDIFLFYPKMSFTYYTFPFRDGFLYNCILSDGNIRHSVCIF